MNHQSSRRADAVLGIILAAFASFTWVATLPPIEANLVAPSEFSATQIMLSIMACAGVWFASRGAEVTGRTIASVIVSANCLTLIGAANFAASISRNLHVEYDGQGYAELGTVAALAAGLGLLVRWVALRFKQ